DVPRDLSPIVVNPPTVTCASTATLTAPVANSYLWTPGGATTRSITTPPLFTNTQFNVTLGYGNAGCTREDSVTVTVTSLPPTISCPANITQSNTTGQCGRIVTYSTTVGGLPTPTETYTFSGATTGSGAGNGSGSFFNVGTTTVTVTATNSCGSVNCSFTVTINDTEPPTVTTGSIGSCYPTVAAAQAAALAATSATDNCPGPLVETASTVGTCSAVITVRTTDIAGNFTDVTYNTRIDNTAPTVTVGTIGSCYPTVAAAEAAALAATSATDNCPGALTEVASTVGTCSAVITVTTTDVCGNSTSVTYNTRIDNTPPSITCPAPVTVSCEGDVPTPDINAPIVSDNCPGVITVSFMGDVISGQTCANRYTITRTYRATDGCGNFTECTQIITVNDQTAPVITCPAPETVSCAANVPAPNIGLVTAFDNCGSLGGPVTITHQGDVISGQTCANRFTITRTYRATDACGNFAECTQIITVNDQTPPTITCPAPVTVSCAADVPAPDIASVTGVSDNCAGVVTVTHQGDVISAQTCANRYTITRTYRATDVCGNFTECTQIITVNDQTAPVITCPAPVTVSCASAVPAPNTASVTATDNCAGVVTITHQGDVISGQTCANRYTITRTYRATDVCGNFAECTQIITVNDQTPPNITCPAPVTVSCASAVPAPNTASVTATDNCAGVVTVTHIGDVISAQTCANRYTITRTYRATDVCGNFAECTQIITVNDQTPPTLTCPAPVTVSCASAVPVPNIASVTGVSDNCAGVVTVTHVGDVISAQTCANRYTITRTYRATDVCGNFAECTQIITVNDQTPPVITCPAPITVACASAVPAPNTALVTATDNCGGVITITHIGDVITNQTCPNRYTLTRTYRATDVCGNFAECTQVITVNDNIAPVITCPANITVTTPVGSCTAVVNFAATATDNCNGAVTITYSQAPGTAFPIGTTTVTATATDACGNSSTCTFTITVRDAQLPTITAQPQNRTVCAGQNATFSVTAITAPSAGGPIAYQWQQANGTVWTNIPGATASTYTVNSVTLSMNTNTFRCVLTGLCTVVNSNPATLFVNSPPTIALTASPLAALLPNQTTSITATVNPPGGTFVWSLNGTPITTVTGPVLGPINVNGIGTYTAVYTDPRGCVSSTASIQIGAQASSQLWVYPNPNTGIFNVRFYNQTGEQVTLKVFNGLGQVVYTQSLPLGVAYSNITVNLGNMPAGVYIVKIMNGTGAELAAKRIVVYRP
ncbi:MAG: HYR domain-containing protein, partial [Chitinophagaceae bacterium]|nr:HYR domain-containing protein [Chitinophagaceae bacterium]